MRALIVALVMSVSVVAVGQSGVNVMVRNHTGVNQTSAAVRGGVPFALGALRECADASLVTAGGEELPCRVRPTARWYDGSIKWLLVDTQVSCPVGGQVRLTLRPGEKSKAEALGGRVKVSDEAEGITVDTGAARFVFSKKVFGLPTAAWIDLNGRWQERDAGG